METNERIIATGFLPGEVGGHLDMRLYRWRELEDLLAQHGEIVAASASGLDGPLEHELFGGLDEETRTALVRWEVELAAEPGARDAGRQVSLPAAVRRRWKTRAVQVEDRGDHVVVRPLPEDPVEALAGVWKGKTKLTTDEVRRQLRSEQAANERRKLRLYGLDR